MPWLKKNLMLVLGGLVGLVLLGGTGFFLFTQASRESGVAAALEERRNEWNRLNGLSPYPEEKNIKSVKEETARVEKLASALKESIRPVEVPQVTDTLSLKLLIETTISQLTEEAEAAGVRLPDRYAFTFQKLREMPRFDEARVPAIAEQVGQIAALCRVLFAAKVHSLDTLRRSPILKEEGGTSDYLTKKSVTNTWVVRTPYDLSFKAFSGELASALKGLAALSNCIAIKTVNIEPTSLPRAAVPGAVMPMPGPSPTTMPFSRSEGSGLGAAGMDPALRARYGLGAGGPGGAEGGGGGPMGMDPALRSRYGLGPGAGGGPGGMDAMRSRYGMGGPGGAMTPPPALSSPVVPGQPMAPGAPSGPSVVIDEKPLRVILQMDFIKPKPQSEPGAAKRVVRPPAASEAGAAAPASEAAPTEEHPATTPE